MSMTETPAASHVPFFATTSVPDMFVTTARKRRAPTPPPIDIAYNVNSSPLAGPSTSSTPMSTPHRDKRRRPNLANGLSSLTIGSRPPRSPSPLPTYEESESTRHEVDEDDQLAGPLDSPDDLQVEELPESSKRERERQFAFSSSSESSADEWNGSHPQYRQPRRRNRRHAINTQQADAVEQPATPWEAREDKRLGVEDVTSPTRRRKRREEVGTSPWRKRSRSDMDLDMDMDRDGDDDIEDIRPRKMPTSYEPEKDRIVVTSLSDTESEASTSRSTSPAPRREFSQPGTQGFTLSPSLLTHLLATQRDRLKHPFSQATPEKGLVLYRPLGIPPGAVPEIVQQWPGRSDQNIEDSGRFEELDEDEGQVNGFHEPDGGDMDVDVEEPMQLD